MANNKRIFISVAEDSADIYAAALVRAVRGALPECSFHGLTGPRMRAEGVETVYDLTAHAAMLSGVLKVVGKGWGALRAAQESWRQRRPALVVLLDSPTLHLPLAKRARAMGIPVLYYIAPQTWASRERRNARIVRDVDRLACILPFEAEYFHKRGVSQAEFVGHPLFETLANEHPNPEVVERLRAGDGPLIAILPGSRRHVIETMLPLQMRVVESLRAAGVKARVAVSAVDETRAGQIRRRLGLNPPPFQGGAGGGSEENGEWRMANGEWKAEDVVVGDNASLLTAADLVLVASGTATLHVAHYRKPMIVMYDAGRMLWLPYRLFGRFVLTTPHLSLVNILAGARIVPEFMPFVGDVREIARVAGQLLDDEAWRERMVAQIDATIAPLSGGNASRRVAEIMRSMIYGEDSAGPPRIASPSRLFVIDEASTLRGRGTLLSPGVTPEDYERVRVGDALELRRPDGPAVRTVITGIEYPPSVKYVGAPSSSPRYGVLVPLGKEQTPVGAEVWVLPTTAANSLTESSHDASANAIQ